MSKETGVRGAIASRLTYANVMATVAVVVAVGGGGFAMAGTTGVRDDRIDACVNQRTGTLRIVADAKQRRCRRGERRLSWNKQGEPGPAGAPGPQGSRGPQGPAGPPGPAGSTATARADAPAPVASRWWRDGDGDGYGDWYEFLDSPGRPPGYVGNHDDCRDDLPTVRPGSTATGTGLDHDCDGFVGPKHRWYRDADGDHAGDPDVSAETRGPHEPPGFVSNNLDCDDRDPSIKPRTKSCRPTIAADRDLDGYQARYADGPDCNDDEGRVFPGWDEFPYDGLDNDCRRTTPDVIGRDPRHLRPSMADAYNEYWQECARYGEFLGAYFPARGWEYTGFVFNWANRPSGDPCPVPPSR